MAALGDGGGGCGSVERRAVRGHSAEPVGRRRGHAGGAWSAVESEVRMAEQGFDAEEAAERGVEGVRGGREGAGGGPGWMFIRQRSRSSRCGSKLWGVGGRSTCCSRDLQVVSGGLLWE